MTTLAQQPPSSNGMPWPLLIMVVMFATPTIAGWFFFFNPQLLPNGRGNSGALIEPSRDISSLTLRTTDGNNFDWLQLRDQWVLATAWPGDCTEDCAAALYQSGQTRLAVGANRARVARLLLLPQGATAPDAATLNRATALTPANPIAFATAFERPNQTEPSGTYIIDPNGRLMMHHAATAPPKLILEDLEQLLKASKSWGQGGVYGHR